MAETTLSVLQFLLPWLPAGLWCAWWLWCVNAKSARAAFAAGGWVVVVLLNVLGALAWSAIFPGPGTFLGVTIPDGWRQLLSCAALTAVAFWCLSIQERMGWTPADVTYEPAAAHDDHHGHGHAHH